MTTEEKKPAPRMRGADLLERCDFRLIETPEDREEVYRLRYKAYLNAGKTAQSPSEKISDKYDEASNTWTFGTYVDGELCMSIRFNVVNRDTPLSGGSELFSDVVGPRVERGEVFLEGSRFCADPDRTGQMPEMPLMVMRLGYMGCLHFGADTTMVMVGEAHYAFWRRVLMHEAIAAPRQYPGFLPPVSLMAWSFRDDRERMMTRFPIMLSSAFERRMLFRRTNAGPSAPARADARQTEPA